MNPTEYAELLILTTTQAYQTAPWIQNNLRQLLTTAYQQSEGRTLTLPELEGIIQQQKENHRSSRNRKAVNNLETIEKTFQHLFQGKTSNAFEAQGAQPNQLHKNLTIIELGEYESYNFRTFLQALIIIQYTAHIKANKLEPSPTIIVIDSAENLFPNRYRIAPHLKQPHLTYKLQENLKEHPNQTIYLTTRYPAELDFYTLHLTKTVITHPLQTMQDISQTQRHLPPATPNLWHIKTHQATIKTWDGQTQLIAIQRPSWLYQQKPTDQQLTTHLTTDPTFTTIPTISEQTSLDRDFGQEAWAACQMLEALKTYDGITRAGLVQTFSTLPSKKAWQIEAKLETQGYVRAVTDEGTRGGQRTVLRLNLTGLRAIKEYQTIHPTLDNPSEQSQTQPPQEKEE